MRLVAPGLMLARLERVPIATSSALPPVASGEADSAIASVPLYETLPALVTRSVAEPFLPTVRTVPAGVIDVGMSCTLAGATVTVEGLAATASPVPAAGVVVSAPVPAR